jgi:hypothetical protein
MEREYDGSAPHADYSEEPLPVARPPQVAMDVLAIQEEHRPSRTGGGEVRMILLVLRSAGRGFIWIGLFVFSLIAIGFIAEIVVRLIMLGIDFAMQVHGR